MKKASIILVLVLTSVLAVAQEEGQGFVFNTVLKEISYEEEQELYESSSGNPLDLGMALMKKEYTYKPAPTPLTPNPTIEVEKPMIYYSVKKLHRQLKKDVKKGNLLLEEAEETLAEVVKISVNIRYLETYEFEKALSKTKDASEIEALFSKVEFQQYSSSK